MFRLGRHPAGRSNARQRWILLPLSVCRIDASGQVGALLGKAAEDDILQIMAATPRKKQTTSKGAATHHLAAH